MSLHDHARAARFLSDAFDRKARRHSFDKAADLMRAMSEAYADAAQTMEREIRREAEAHAQAARCTLDHATMKGPACPACKAPIARR